MADIAAAAKPRMAHLQLLAQRVRYECGKSDGRQEREAWHHEERIDKHIGGRDGENPFVHLDVTLAYAIFLLPQVHEDSVLRA